MKKVPTFPGPSVQTPLVHEKPAVITMSGWGVAVAAGVVEAWSVSVACGPVGVDVGVSVACGPVGVDVGVGMTCVPVGVDVGAGGELVGVAVRDPWRAETE